MILTTLSAYSDRRTADVAQQNCRFYMYVRITIFTQSNSAYSQRYMFKFLKVLVPILKKPNVGFEKDQVPVLRVSTACFRVRI